MKNFKGHVSRLFRHKQFLRLGDTDHGDQQLRSFVYSHDFIKFATEQGARHICLEQSTTRQFLVDGLCDGSLSKEQFREGLYRFSVHSATFLRPDQIRHNVALLADAILMADHKGIKIHFVDGHEGNEKIAELLSLWEKFYEENEADMPWLHDPIDPRTTAVKDKLLKKITGKTIVELFGSEEALEEMFADRMSKDHLLASRIQAACGDEKAVIFYGSFHGAMKGTLDDCLARDNVAALDLYSSASKILLDGSHEDFYDYIPQAKYFIIGDTIEMTPADRLTPLGITRVTAGDQPGTFEL